MMQHFYLIQAIEFMLLESYEKDSEYTVELDIENNQWT